MKVNKRTDFREALIRRMAASGATAADISRRTGAPKTIIDKLRQRKCESTNVDAAERIASYFGLTLDEFIGRSVSEDVVRIRELLSQLSEAERDVVTSQLEGMLARKKAR